MSWLQDYYEKAIYHGSNAWSKALEYNPFVPGAARNAAANGIRNEVTNKSSLRAAEVLEFASGLPFVGPFLGGINGINKLEDLYDRTGKLPAYPGSGSSGAGGLGHSLASVAKIADGNNDLYQYYAGEPDQYTPTMYR